MEVLPKREWMDFTFRIVEYGRKFCPAKKHDHKSCPLSKIF
jgi:endonuclease III